MYSITIYELIARVISQKLLVKNQELRIQTHKSWPEIHHLQVQSHDIKFEMNITKQIKILDFKIYHEFKSENVRLVKSDKPGSI